MDLVVELLWWDRASLWEMYLLLLAFFYLVSLVVLFSTGFFIEKLNHSHPQRKIQKRGFSSPSGRDIRSSAIQLFFTSLCISLGIFAQYAGWTFYEPLESSWWSLPTFFVLSLILHDSWFYWGHRALHTRWLYRFHSPHHRNVTPSVWSNDAGHFVDTLFAHSYYAIIVFIMPIPANALILHRIFDQISAAVGHCGYEHFASPTARKPWPFLCTVFHDQHHQYFLYNYGNYFSLWDRLCKTVHPEYDNRVKAFENIP